MLQKLQELFSWITRERHLSRSSSLIGLGFLALLNVVFFVVLERGGADLVEKPEPVNSDSLVNTRQQLPGTLSESSSLSAAPVPVVPQELPNVDIPLVHKPEPTVIPRIALHNLNFSQYSQSHSNGPEMAEMIASLLMIKLGQSDQIELLDRSLVSTLFTEKSRLLVGDPWSSNQATLNKLPLSELTLVGSLFSSSEGKSFSLKLVVNRTGQVVGAKRFFYSIETIEESIRNSLTAVLRWAESFKTEKLARLDDEKQRIAFGHFTDISENDSELSQGQDITERLIEKYTSDNNFTVLARTQMFPLVFEQYLRILQHTDESQESKRPNTDYLVYGKYWVDSGNKKQPITIYLYFDLMKYGRELVELNANNWVEAIELVNKSIDDFLPDVEKKSTAAEIKKSHLLFRKATNISGAGLGGNRGEIYLSSHNIQKIAFSSPPEIAATARELIEQSLEEYPSNQFSKLVLAKFIEAEGDSVKSKQMILEVLRGQNPVAAKEALYFIKRDKRDFSSDYAIPSPYHPKNMSNIRKLYQSPYVGKHNLEAAIHFGTARTVSNIHINQTTTIPTVEFYNASKQETGIRRRSNFEVAIDGFSSSVFIDPSYLKAMIFLGYSLCQAEVERCASGQMIHNWVVDNAQAENLQGRDGMYIHVTPDIVEKDRLIFLAADAVDRVVESNTSEMFKSTLMQGKYFIKKYKKKLDGLLDSGKTDQSEEQMNRIVYTYVQLIQAQCTNFIRRSSRKNEFVRLMDSLAVFESKNDGAATLRISLLADLVLECPPHPLLIPHSSLLPPIANDSNSGYGKGNGIIVEKFIKIAPINDSSMLQPENRIERLFSEGYRFSINQEIASKAFPKKPAAGPLLDSYFSTLISKNRNVGVLKERLFENGYLSVSGLPLLNDRVILRRKIKEDFFDLKGYEQESIRKTILAANKVKFAGYVEIYNHEGDDWQLQSTLNPEDAIEGRRFGMATAIDGDNALVCSIKDGLYTFKKVDGRWLQQQRINTRCINVAMMGDWAVVHSKEEVFVYKRNANFWVKVQTLKPNNYLYRVRQYENFENFGASLAMWKGSIFIGNPLGGSERVGEVYIFTLSNNEWTQTRVLSPNTINSQFGKSLSVNDDYLVIGDPSTITPGVPFIGSGSVFVYANENSNWRLWSRLVPKDSRKTWDFGKEVLLKKDNASELLIKSRKAVFHHDLLGDH